MTASTFPCIGGDVISAFRPVLRPQRREENNAPAPCLLSAHVHQSREIDPFALVSAAINRNEACHDEDSTTPDGPRVGGHRNGLVIVGYFGNAGFR
jgi:hypothetical protein